MDYQVLLNFDKCFSKTVEHHIYFVSEDFGSEALLLIKLICSVARHDRQSSTGSGGSRRSDNKVEQFKGKNTGVCVIQNTVGGCWLLGEK